MLIPEPVKNAALFPDGDLPEPPPEHPYRQVRRDGYMVGLFPGQTYGTVTVRSLGAGAVEQTVQEVRRLLGEDGKSRAAWMVADAASPEGLAERLQECGLMPFEEAPFEPRFAAMALVSAPEGGDDGIEARPPTTFEEFQASNRVGFEVFDVSDEDRTAFEPSRSARSRCLPGSRPGPLGRRRRDRHPGADGLRRANVATDPRTAWFPDRRLDRLPARRLRPGNVTTRRGRLRSARKYLKIDPTE